MCALVCFWMLLRNVFCPSVCVTLNLEHNLLRRGRIQKWLTNSRVCSEQKGACVGSCTFIILQSAQRSLFWSACAREITFFAAWLCCMQVAVQQASEKYPLSHGGSTFLSVRWCELSLVQSDSFINCTIRRRPPKYCNSKSLICPVQSTRVYVSHVNWLGYRSAWGYMLKQDWVWMVCVELMAPKFLNENSGSVPLHLIGKHAFCANFVCWGCLTCMEVSVIIIKSFSTM